MLGFERKWMEKKKVKQEQNHLTTQFIFIHLCKERGTAAMACVDVLPHPWHMVLVCSEQYCVSSKVTNETWSFTQDLH